LENAKEAVAVFKRRLNVEVIKQEKLNLVEKRDFRREELLEKYTVKMLYRWNNRKFREEYLKKLEKKLVKMKVSFSRKETLKKE